MTHLYIKQTISSLVIMCQKNFQINKYDNIFQRILFSLCRLSTNGFFIGTTLK